VPTFVVWAISALGTAIGGAAGAFLIMNAAAIASAGLLLGAAALSGAQARKAQRKQREAYNASLVDRMANVVTTIGQRELVLGRVRKAGTVFARASTGATKEKFVMCVALAGHEIDAVETVYLNEVAVTLDGSGYVTSEPYSLSRNLSATESATGTDTVLAHAPVADSVTVTLTTGTGMDAVTEIVPHTLAGSTVTIGTYTGGEVIAYQYAESASKARIRSYLGAASQTADATLISLFPGEWTSDHRARGVAYLICEFDYDETAFPSGIPTVSATIRGAKVFDPRDATTAWSDNPALLVRHVLTHNSFGKRTSLTAAEDARISAAANACDTEHDYVVDGDTTTRALFKAGYVVPYGSPAKDALDDLCQAMAGMWAYAAGEFFVRAGVYTAPVITLTDADLAVVKRSNDGSAQQQPIVIGVHQARADKVNIVTPRIWDEAQGYKQVALTPLAASALITRDGAWLAREVDMPAITYAPQALHVAGVIVRDDRDPLRVTLPFKLRAYPVELFDVVALTLSRYGWTAKAFLVLGRSWTLDGLLQLTLKETAAAIYEVDAEFDAQGYADNTNLPRPWQIVPPTITSVASGAAYLLQQDDGTMVPRIRVAWTAITDASLLQGGQVEVQHRLATVADWASTTVPAGDTQAYLQGFNDADVVLIRARTRNSVAVSDWSVQLTHAVTGKTDAPGAPTGLAAASIIRGIRLTWTNPPDLDLRAVEVWEGTSSTLGAASKIAEVSATVYNRSNLYQTDGARYYWVRAVDTSGNYSAYTGPVNDVADVVVSADLDAGSIDLAKFAADVEPVKIVTSIPGTLGTRNIFNVTAGADYGLHRWSGGAYVKTIPTTDLTGTITAGQMAANSITAGNAAIASAAVDTLQIAGTAVTAPAVQASSSDVTLTTVGVTYELAVVSINFGAIPPANVIINGVAAFKPASGSPTTFENVEVVLVRSVGGSPSEVITATASLYGNLYQVVPLQFMDTTSLSANTVYSYSIRARRSGGPASNTPICDGASIVVLGAKR
jgi:hypothetical protein